MPGKPKRGMAEFLAEQQKAAELPRPQPAAAAENGATADPAAPARSQSPTLPAAEVAVEVAAEMDTGMLNRWRWQLGATARKAAAARARADTAQAEWERLVADAAAVGVPRRLVVSAAADADLDPPGIRG